MAEAFKIIMHEFLDVDDVAYHQAFIKLVAGTDNRAKNTYFQIIGPIYTNKATVTDGEVDLVKIKGGDNDGKKGYIKEDLFYEVSIEGGTFYGFNPANNPEGEGTTYVADGYTVVETTDGEIPVYTVVKDSTSSDEQ